MTFLKTSFEYNHLYDNMKSVIILKNEKMKSIQEIFQKIQELKKERRELTRDLKYLLDNDEAYQELLEKIKTLRDKKREIEESNKPPRLDEIKDELKNLNQMISDIAISTIMSGQNISLKDENDIEYEPVYRVSFKKVK